MKTCVFLNRESSAAARIGPRLEILQRRTRNCAPLQLAPGLNPRERLRRALDDGCQRLIVVGGDGTVSHLTNDLAHLGADIELAVLPAGTGNDLARSLGIPIESVEAAWELAVDGDAVEIDLVRVTDGDCSYFINAATGGFGGKVAADVAAREKGRWGPFAYWMTAASELADLQEYQVRLDLQGQSIQSTIYGLGICNGRFVGGGFPIAPHALLNDGLLHVTAIPVLPALELLAAGLNFTLGHDDRAQPIMSYRCSRVHVHAEPELPFSIDGEPVRTIDAVFEVQPKALRVVAAANAPAIQVESADGQSAA